MNVREMHYIIKTNLKSISNDDSLVGRITSNAIDSYLNMAQDRILQSIFNNDALYEDVSLQRKVQQEFRNLLSNDNAIGVDAGTYGGIPNSKIFSSNLPSDYLYYVKSTSTLTRSSEGASPFNLPNNVIDFDEIDTFMTSNFNIVVLRGELKTVLAEDSIIVIHEAGDTVTALNLMYIRRPKKMTLQALTGVYAAYTQTCELPVHLHEKVVSEAQAIAYQTMPQNYSIGDNERNK